MAKIQINRVTNANVYLDGVNLLGRATKVTLPAINQVMEEHAGLGMMGKPMVPTGGVTLDNASFDMAPYYPDVLRRAANPNVALPLQVRASVDEFGGGGLVAQRPLVASLTGVFTKISFGDMEQQKAVAQTLEFVPYYFKLIIDGDEIIECDLFNNIYKVNAEDLLSRFRSIIGG